MAKVFITGANGFLGSHLAYSLSKNHDVVAYSRIPLISSEFQSIQGDILDKSKLIESMAGCSTVIHFAAITPHSEINTHKYFAFRNYMEGTLNVLEAMQKHEVNTLIYASSGKVYGYSNRLPYMETEYPHPSNVMGKLKFEVENILKTYCEVVEGCGRCIVLRLFNAYGNGQKQQFLIPKIIESLKYGEIKLGRTDIQRDYIHVSDIISAINTLIDTLPNGYYVYNIGTGTPISTAEIIRQVCEISNCKLNVVFDISQNRTDERVIEYPNISKLLSLGWTPKMGLAEGLEMMLTDVRVNNYSHMRGVLV